MTDPTILAALKSALDADPRNATLWIHYASLLEGAERPDEAIEALRNALELDAGDDALRPLIPLLRRTGRLDEALIRVERRLESGEDTGFREELEKVTSLRGGAEDPEASSPRLAEASVEPDPDDPDAWAAQFDWGDLRVKFEDVAGLEDVKRQIKLRIIAPYENPEIYRAYGRDAGGGLLLYGPPGCGKTYVARATAGELGARFVSVSLHEIVDKYWGQSEKLIHALFEDARRSSPTVLFFDEFDALGSSRGGHSSQFWNTLVNQLLQEMDGMAGRNTDILVFAATNMPWKVDPAFRRPGRFDRVLFVTPPDREGREGLLARLVEKLPGGEAIDVEKLAKATPEWTGADLRGLCERATETALERALDDGQVHRILPSDFERALASSDTSASEWFGMARNYARYSNDGQYDELVSYLKRIKRW